MLGHVTTITHKNNLVLSNIDPGAGETSTRKVKMCNLPNIFDDDCSHGLCIFWYFTQGIQQAFYGSTFSVQKLIDAVRKSNIATD